MTVDRCTQDCRVGEVAVVANVLDVAAYILDKQGSMTTMKLQKLCYYSQGWSLAWDEVPLYKDNIEAWANGPVTRNLYRAHRGLFRVDTIPGGRPNELDDDERETIDAVLLAYGELSGQQLSELTHRERPWVSARGGAPEGASSSAKIDLEVMQDFFSGLDAANRAR